MNGLSPAELNNRGAAMAGSGSLDDAVSDYRAAIRLQPIFPEAYFNLGSALHERGDLLAALAAYDRAIAQRPRFPQAMSHRGDVLKLLGRLDDAVAAYRAAMAAAPTLAVIQNNLGNVLKDQGRLDDAIASYREAMRLAPGKADYHSNLVYGMLFQPGSREDAIAAELAEWNRRHALPLAGKIKSLAVDRSPDRRLRVGYVSPDFRDHVVGRNVWPLLREHDRSRFEITLYSNVTRPDAMTEQFRQKADAWRDITRLSDEAAAEQVRADGIDVLVDLTLHMSGNRLGVFAYKPAPVQMTFAGYPGSTGLTAMDYRLTDPHLDPPDERVRGSEKLLRLPATFWCYDALTDHPPEVGPLPAIGNGHVTFGYLGNFCKINASVRELWARVLNAVPQSRLVMLAAEGSHRGETIEHFEQLGIDANRIRFVPPQQREQYLAAYQQIDITLDTFPYGAHTTSLDSLWMGVPVVTLIGQSAVGRAGWSQLSNLGLGGLAAADGDAFVQIATRLAGDASILSQLRADLRGRLQRSLLMDSKQLAQAIESAYRRAWRTFCASA